MKNIKFIQMKRFLLYLSVLLLLHSCFLYKTRFTSTIIGRWCLVNTSQINYPKISFNKDSIAVFESRMDTVYSFKYYIKKRYLILTQSNGKIIKNKIIFLNNDSLVFRSLIENKNIQVYIKCDR